MNLNFHKKQFISVAILIFILMTVCISAFSFYTYNNLKKQSVTNLSQLNERTAVSLDALFDDMDKLSLYVSTNPNIMQAFMDAKSVGYSNKMLADKISRIIYSISVPNSSSRFRISLYNPHGNFISSGIPHSEQLVRDRTQSADYTQWYDTLPIVHNNLSLSPFHADYWSEDHTRYLSLYREIFDPYFNSTATGIVDVQCPYELIEETLLFESNELNCYIVGQSGTFIFPLEQELSIPQDLYDKYAGDSVSPAGTAHNLTYSFTPINNGWSLLMTESQSTIWNVLLPQITTIVIIGTVTLIIFLIMMFLVTKRTTRPLRELTASVKNVSLSNLSLEADTQTYPDEISSLNLAFENMFTRLRQSMDEVVRIQAYEMQANMVALQAQMDPHFLYNILTIIKALSREQNTRQIGITCDYLAKMLRYISNYNDSSVLFANELEHTECYLKLMKIRYEDQFTYHLDIAPGITKESLHIPKLTLQPLVENCFQHGFKEVAPPWLIEIRCWCKAGQWFIQVADNGGGITAAGIAQLNNRIEQFLSNPSDSLTSLKIGGMGLVNTVARLKLKYKEKLIFQIENRPSGGTTVLLGGVIDDEHIFD